MGPHGLDRAGRRPRRDAGRTGGVGAGDGSMTIKQLRDAMLAAPARCATRRRRRGQRAPIRIAHTVGCAGRRGRRRAGDARRPQAIPTPCSTTSSARAGATTVVGRDGAASPGRPGGIPTARPPPRPPSAPTAGIDPPHLGLDREAEAGPAHPRRRSARRDVPAARRLPDRSRRPPLDLRALRRRRSITLVMGALLARATVVFAPFARESVDAFLAERRIRAPTSCRRCCAWPASTAASTVPAGAALRALMTGGEKSTAHTAEVLPERSRGGSSARTG